MGEQKVEEKKGGCWGSKPEQTVEEKKGGCCGSKPEKKVEEKKGGCCSSKPEQKIVEKKGGCCSPKPEPKPLQNNQPIQLTVCANPHSDTTLSLTVNGQVMEITIKKSN